MEDLITIIIVALIFGGAALWKAIAKLLAAAPSARNLAEAGKRSKSLFETLASGDLEDFVKMLGGEEEEKPQPPPSPPASREFIPPAASAEEEPATEPQPPWVRPTPRRRRRAQQVEPREAKRTEPKPPPPVPRVRPKVQAKARGSLRERLDDPRELREAVLLREIFGPPRAAQLRPQPWIPGQWGNPRASRPMPAGAMAAAPPRPAKTKTPSEETVSVPARVKEMYRLGMITREQFEELRDYFASHKEKPE